MREERSGRGGSRNGGRGRGPQGGGNRPRPNSRPSGGRPNASRPGQSSSPAGRPAPARPNGNRRPEGTGNNFGDGVFDGGKPRADRSTGSAEGSRPDPAASQGERPARAASPGPRLRTVGTKPRTEARTAAGPQLEGDGFDGFRWETVEPERRGGLDRSSSSVPAASGRPRAAGATPAAAAGDQGVRLKKRRRPAGSAGSA